jgi:V-type H+-transporting ATPase subunit d
VIDRSLSLEIDEFIWLFQQYRPLFDGVGTNAGDKTIEDKFFEHEVRLVQVRAHDEYRFLG